MLLDAANPTDQRIAIFKTFGFVHVKDAFSQTDFAALESDFRHAMKPGGDRQPFNRPDRPQSWAALCMSETTPNVVELATSSKMIGLAAAMLGGDAICVQAACYKRSEDIFWHCDNIELSYEGLKVYINLESVDQESGALRAIPLSQLMPTGQVHFPRPGAEFERAFGLPPDQVPSMALVAKARDLILFNLRTWHAVCNSRHVRRVLELTYYKDPDSVECEQDFVEQMEANTRPARRAGKTFYSDYWKAPHSNEHERGLRRLAALGVI